MNSVRRADSDLETRVPILSVLVRGIPVPKGRPRAFKLPTGQIRVYDPPQNLDWKRTVIAQVLEGINRQGAWRVAHGPLAVELAFGLPRPKSVSPKRRPHPITKPDCDNLAKNCLDAMRGVVYRDDAQIVELSVTKAYRDVPGVGIRVEVIR